MAYSQHHDPDWDNPDFDMTPLFDDDLDQTQAYTLDPSANPFANMASLQNNPQPTEHATDPRTMPPVPMLRWAMQKKHEQPWHAGRDQVASAPLSVDTMFRQQYRDPAPSDAASSIAGPQDSGYATRQYTFSAGSGEEPSSFNKECPALEGPMENMATLRKTSRASSTRLSVPSTSAPRHVRRQSAKTDPAAPMLLSCTVQDCTKTFKLASELKKHVLKHEKPFTCPRHDCERFLDGFTTTNDLERHKVTKHHIFTGPTKAWRCAAPGCRSKQKYWFRLDNFRQHIWRTHSKILADIDRIAGRSATTVGNEPGSLPSQSPCLTAPESMPEEETSPDQSFDYSSSGLPEYDLTKDGCLMNVQNSNWSPFESSSVFDGYSGQGGMQSSYRAFSDAGTAPFDRSSYMPTQPTSPFSFPSESSMIEPTFSSRSVSPGQSSWLSTASTNSRMAQGQQPRPMAKRYPASLKPQVVVHQPDSDATRDTADLQATAKAILEQGLTDEQLSESLYSLLESRKVQRFSNQGSRSHDISPSSRDVSVSPSRGRAPISAASGMYTGHANSSMSDRAVSQSSDRSQGTSSRGRTLHQNDALPNSRKITCPDTGCGKKFDRRSALDKHMRRHEKPYACTFDECRCTKVFGSKNDWKRHENSQHMQPDLWRCKDCFKSFQTKKLFEAHLEQVHGYSDRDAIRTACRCSRIGVNHSGSFWCGFCEEILPLDSNKKGVMAWDERFNHIANHFVPDKEHADDQRRIQDWLPPDGRKKKGEKDEIAAAAAAQDAYAVPQETAGDDGTHSSSSATYLGTNPLGYAEPDIDASVEQFARQNAPATSLPRRGSSKRKRTETEIIDKNRAFRICCMCTGARPWKLVDGCTDCGHIFCDKCLTEEAE